MNDDLVAFGEGLASIQLSEVDLAVALLWFLEHTLEAHDVTTSELADVMHDLSLRGRVNSTRLGTRLTAHGDVVRGKRAGSYKIKLSKKSLLEQKYESLLKRPMPKVESHVLASDDFLATRRYLETLVRQINGSYQFGFYDACVVLCRRLMETLLIEAFEQNSHSAAIKHQGNYVQLSDIIGIAKSGQFIKLSRGSAEILEEVKSAGDTAAHNRTYITKPQDVDDLKLKFRRVIAELMHLAKIEPARNSSSSTERASPAG
ncbi:hypothetical protein [Bradyrhizobium sp. 25ACV]